MRRSIWLALFLFGGLCEPGRATDWVQSSWVDGVTGASATFQGWRQYASSDTDVLPGSSLQIKPQQFVWTQTDASTGPTGF
ncbi:MAG: hypothetical protein HYZ74_03555, partial [Elusimicrobia bacterium]|nr:hypothetical protein [Elusimicrobiota bacterium]